MTRLHRRRAILLGLAAAPGVLALAASANAQSAATRGARSPDAEKFVEAQVQRVLSLLADRGLTAGQRDAAFRRAIGEIADIPRITTFVLGKYGRTITPAQRAQFTAAFRAYAENVYQARIAEFRGVSVRATGSVARRVDDVVVSSVIQSAAGGPPTAASWRLLASGGAWKIVDVQIKGVWLAITQQQDFVSTIDNAGGDINVLIKQLQRGVGPRPR
jgi:phospholipid transport system substrate-binding protein